jgi:hypothetical protein
VGRWGGGEVVWNSFSSERGVLFDDGLVGWLGFSSEAKWGGGRGRRRKVKVLERGVGEGLEGGWWRRGEGRRGEMQGKAKAFMLAHLIFGALLPLVVPVVMVCPLSFGLPSMCSASYT